MTNLIFWRHAEAEVNSNTGADADRVLTKAGHKDAAKMAKWLNQHLPANTEVFCSPAMRCLETVAALQQLNPIEVKVVDFLSIESTAKIIANKICNGDTNTSTLIVGHQPNLGLVIAKLLGMNENACVVKKGAVWWLRRRESDGVLQTYLFAVKHPDY